MGILSNHRGSRTETNQEAFPVSAAGLSVQPKKRWSNLLPLFVALVVIVEIAFLGKLDMAKNTIMVDTWADLIYWSREVVSKDDSGSHEVVAKDDLGIDMFSEGLSSEYESCEEWLEREDAVTYSRNFTREPILVNGADQEWNSCAVGCQFGYNSGNKPDAGFGMPQQAGTASVLRSMESSQYYAENNIAMARRWEGI